MLSKKKERWPPRRYWTLCFELASSTSRPASSINRSSRAVSNGAAACGLLMSSMDQSPWGQSFAHPIKSDGAEERAQIEGAEHAASGAYVLLKGASISGIRTQKE